jgi:hypothetical protein
MSISRLRLTWRRVWAELSIADRDCLAGVVGDCHTRTSCRVQTLRTLRKHRRGRAADARRFGVDDARIGTPLYALYELSIVAARRMVSRCA